MELPINARNVQGNLVSTLWLRLTHVSVYQEYLARTWTDKYGKLSMQMDKIIHDANAEIDNLTQRLTGLQSHFGTLNALS